MEIQHGDCRVLMAALPEDSVDAIVTDPPYGLEFMGKGWDHGVPGVPFWTEALRVLKPGGHLIAFGGTRTFHRLTCALEDAGFEVRDCLSYLYGSGFPKSLNLDRLGLFCACSDGESPDGESSTERDVRPVPSPHIPPPVHAADQPRKVLFAGLQEQGAPDTGRSQSPAAEDGPRQSGMEGRRHVPSPTGQLRVGAVRSLPFGVAPDGEVGRLLRDGASAGRGAAGASDADADGGRASRGPRPAEQHAVEPGAVAGQPIAQARGAWPPCDRCGKPLVPRGLGTALKPAWEPAVLCRKPLVGTVAANVQAHGTGAINVDGCRIAGQVPSVPQPDFTSARGRATHLDATRRNGEMSVAPGGRWPANVLLDEEAAALLDGQSGTLTSGLMRAGQQREGIGYHGGLGDTVRNDTHGDRGGASRFFYTAKASSSERHYAGKNTHPTVKPVDLMRWLCRLVTPAGGLVLDPFCGSGSTGIAALAEGFRFIGMEQDEASVRIARRRIAGPLFAESGA